MVSTRFFVATSILLLSTFALLHFAYLQEYLFQETLPFSTNLNISDHLSTTDSFCGNEPRLHGILTDKMCKVWKGHVFNTPNSHPIPTSTLQKAPFRLTYEKYVNLPNGKQDDGGFYVDGWIVSIAGFCGGQLYMGSFAYCCGTRGFMKTTVALDTTHPEKGWQQILDFPGAPRQFLSCEKVNKALYCWGGFSYTPISRNDPTPEELSQPKQDPYGFRDGYRLEKMDTLDSDSNSDGDSDSDDSDSNSDSNDKTTTSFWKWTKLPDVPKDIVVSSGICHFNSDSKHSKYIYYLGGADYDSNQFHTATDRNGQNPNLSSTFLRFDSTNESWKVLPPLPGTSRFGHSMQCVDEHVYVHSGMTGGVSYRMTTTNLFVADNWRYSIVTNNWERIEDTPIDVGNLGIHSITLSNRYILMLGGAISSSSKMTGRRWENALGWREWMFGADSWWSNLFWIDENANRYAPMPFTWNVKNMGAEDRPGHVSNGNTFMVGSYSSVAVVYDTKQLKYYFTDSMPLGNNGIMLVKANEKELYAWGGESNMGCVEGSAFGQHPKLVMKIIVDYENKQQT